MNRIVEPTVMIDRGAGVYDSGLSDAYIHIDDSSGHDYGACADRCVRTDPSPRVDNSRRVRAGKLQAAMLLGPYSAVANRDNDAVKLGRP